MKVPWTRKQWRRVLVYGLGASGMAAARLLRSRAVEVVGVDEAARDALDLSELDSDQGVELIVGETQQALPPRIDGVVVSPGIPLDRPLLVACREAGLRIIAEVELAFLFARGPVIGITGSNGKSTTTALTGQLLTAAGLEAEVCGNIGVPLSAKVERPEDRIFVTELSSFQLECVDTFRPRAAALLNLSADHLDRHRDEQAYFAAKLNLFKRQLAGDVAVLNADDRRVAAVEVPSRRRLFSRRQQVDDGCYLDGDVVVEADPATGNRPLFQRSDLSLRGDHNLENAMAAALLSRAMGAAAAGFGEALRGFHGLPHRMQEVLDRQGVTWIDDSKATNFAATLRSLETFSRRSVHLILGGRNKGGDPATLARAVERTARRLYLVGEAADEIGAALSAAAPTEVVGTMESAVSSAAQRVRGGDTVLLSPACASFDQYRGFAERGDHFQKLVRALDG